MQRRIWFKSTFREPRRRMLNAQSFLACKRDIQLGWTQVQDPGGSFAEVELFKKLHDEGKIKLRIYKALSAPGPDAQRLLHDGPIIGADDYHLTVRSLKLYADGSLGSRSAALLTTLFRQTGHFRFSDHQGRRLAAVAGRRR